MPQNSTQSTTPFRQNFHDSCLVACALMASGKSKYPVEAVQLERAIFIEAEERCYPYFVQSMLAAITTHLSLKCRLYVDNKYFAAVLKDGLAGNKAITIEQLRVSSESLRQKYAEHGHAIAFVDGHHLGDYAHWPHYVFVEKISADRITFIDPNTAGRRYYSDPKMDLAINGLRNHLRICPFIVIFE